MSTSMPTLKVQFRGFAQRFGQTLEKEMACVSEGIVSHFDDARLVGYGCTNKNGIGFLQFEGEVDVPQVLNMLHSEFVVRANKFHYEVIPTKDREVLGGFNSMGEIDDQGQPLPIPTIFVVRSPRSPY